jgi:hypothetical protein
MKILNPGSLVAFATIALVSLLAGCSANVSLEAAPDSNSYACAEFSVRLPDTLDGLARRSTDAQATGAWGTPAAVITRCGLPEVSVSKLRCVTAGGVEWLVDETMAPSYRFISFGRAPATEVIIDSNKVSGANVLDELSNAVLRTKLIRTCTGL